ncbi:tRNA pseudouridine(38-40) synthase TruA [Limibacter armeniacum]|uniref:tRNA pseudouridine synthase A n=1 Tax=Limibacter armeniacum TaxID=466084 RepID=UPI002FE65115
MKKKRYYYLVQFQYLGYRYHGWMKQPNAKTVQEMVDKTFNYIFGGEVKFTTLAASRTDALVSANHAAFELFVWQEQNPETLKEALNINLPSDIRVLSVEEVDDKFNVIQDSKQKEYIYLFSYGEKIHPFCAPYMSNFPEELDIELMKKGAKRYEGLNNFQRFCVKPAKDAVFEREIDFCEIVDNDLYTASFFPEKSYLFRIKGKGFLRHQVRVMMGALCSLGRGSLTWEEFDTALKSGGDGPISFMAQASGLQLHALQYNEENS